jgi:hypothetical protein
MKLIGHDQARSSTTATEARAGHTGNSLACLTVRLIVTAANQKHKIIRSKASQPVMRLSPGRACLQSIRMLIVLAVVGAAIGCSRGEEATGDAIAQAKARWMKAAIRNYDLEWTVTGPNNAHYYVTVEEGDVRKIELEEPDGTRLEIRSPSPSYFSVDGLFLTIANEITLAKSDHPFNQPNGTKVVMRFQPDPELGYPHWYRRDVMGTPQTVTIDVVKLTPRSLSSEQPKR